MTRPLKKNQIKAYIPTCDRFRNLIEANLIGLELYFPTNIKIIILGYKKPYCKLSQNVKFISMGVDRGTKYWATDLRNYFESIDDEYFIYMNDDCVLIKKVTNEMLNKAIQLFNNPKVGRVSLTHDILNDRQHLSFNEIAIESLQTEDYRISTQYSIWRKKYLLKYLSQGLSPWEFELNQSQNAKNDGFHILGLKEPIFYFLHLFKKGYYRANWNIVSHNSMEPLSKKLESKIQKIIQNDKEIYKSKFKFSFYKQKKYLLGYGKNILKKIFG